MDRRVVRPGEAIHLTLYWQALVPMEKDYSVFVHVVGVEDQVWARSDQWPDQGTDPTSIWELDEIVEDEHDLVLGETTPPGFYDVKIGIHDRGERLPTLAEDGRWASNRVALCKIRVVEE